LHNVADRTARLGGTLQIESRSGAGTRIIVEIPHGSEPGADVE